MNEKKLFSFQLENSLKERMKVITKYRVRSIGYFINEAIEVHLKDWEERLKKYYESKSNTN
jgi:predicted DNA-binding protein